LRAIAAALLAKAADGDVPAINTLADRTDGKVAQALIGDSEQDAVQLHHTITRKIVDPDAKEAASSSSKGSRQFSDRGAVLSDDHRGALDNADPEDVRQALIDVLRQSDGAELRALLKVLRDDDDTIARGLYEITTR
jgi:hypothetical protein